MLIDRGIVSEGVIFCRSPASRIRRTTTTGGYIIGPHVHEADLRERVGSQNRHSRAIATFILGLIPKLVKRSQNRAHTLITFLTVFKYFSVETLLLFCSLYKLRGN